MSADPSLERPEPSLSSARLERQWTNVRERVASPAAVMPRWAWASLGALALAAFAVVVVSLGRTSAPTVLAEGSAIETSHAPTQVALAEGSVLEVGPESRVAVAEAEGDDVAVRVERGRARFDVARRPSRHFRVRASTARGEDVEVVVVGTAFTVAHEGDEVAVRVERGIVEVHLGAETVRLVAGGAWRSRGPIAATAAEPSDVVAEPSDVAAEPSDVVAEPSDVVAEPASPMGTEGPRGTRVREPRDARTLFEQAREARQAGSVAEAARLYAELVAQHDDDPRADVAAFELARLRMDHLGDPRGALRAIDRALAGGGSFREDAMARRAVLLDRLGRDAECRSAREAYLATFGAGVHRAEVGALCP